MNLIPSFTVDHTRLMPGVYVSRIDDVDGNKITTYDIRLKRPNVEPCAGVAAMHTLEHLIATYLRNDNEWKDSIIYWGPMGCLTGFYLIIKGQQPCETIGKLMIKAFEFAASFNDKIPGTEPENCGNYLLHNLPMAQYEAKKYVEVLKTNPCYMYPEKENVTFAGKKYTMTFFDDFSGKDLDTNLWERCPEWQRQDAGGYWRNECSYIEDSCLVIEAKKNNGNLVSGAVRSKDKFEQSNGLFKIRFKAEKASGLWYAFWLMTEKEHEIGGGAKNGGEIDIFEILPNDPNAASGKQTYLNSAVHWDGYGDEHKSHESRHFIDDSFYNQWHEITFEWTPEYYKAYLDDSTKPYWDSTVDGAEAWGGIVTSKNYMKITAEFGKWGGKVDENALPARMFVDWVKVYKAD